MLIIGAKGFAKEILEVVSLEMKLLDEEIYFFDDISNDLSDKVFDRFHIFKSFEEVKKHFSITKDKRFVIGIGNPLLRGVMYEKFIALGAEPYLLVSSSSKVGSFDVSLGKCSSIMAGVIITNSITIGKGCLINLNCTIGHDSDIGDFVELSPSVNISGRCKIGNYTSIGTSASLIPNITIGENVIVAAGAVVTKNVPSNCMVAGVPAQIKKTLTPLDL